MPVGLRGGGWWQRRKPSGGDRLAGGGVRRRGSATGHAGSDSRWRGTKKATRLGRVRWMAGADGGQMAGGTATAAWGSGDGGGRWRMPREVEEAGAFTGP